jgi:hypothetical protein
MLNNITKGESPKTKMLRGKEKRRLKEEKGFIF